jgi:1,4-alpha-glucan branching enzyme
MQRFFWDQRPLLAREVFNSDASVYGGDNVGNYGSAIPSTGGAINLTIPAHGFIVLIKES